MFVHKKSETHSRPGLAKLLLWGLFTLTILPIRATAHSDVGVFGDGDKLREAPEASYRSDVYPGQVRIDLRRMLDIVLKVNARITSLRDLYPGRRVSKGDVLMTFDSPELETVQKTFIETVRNFDAMREISTTGREKVIEGRMNLEWRGLPARELRMVEESGEAIKQISVIAPANGYIVEVRVTSGEIVNAGTQSGLFSAAGAVVARIAQDDAILVDAYVPLDKANKLIVGTLATLSLGGNEVSAVPGVIEQISPTVEANQTRQVRIKPSALSDLTFLRDGAAVRVTFEESHD